MLAFLDTPKTQSCVLIQRACTQTTLRGSCHQWRQICKAPMQHQAGRQDLHPCCWHGYQPFGIEDQEPEVKRPRKEEALLKSPRKPSITGRQPLARLVVKMMKNC